MQSEYRVTPSSNESQQHKFSGLPNHHVADPVLAALLGSREIGFHECPSEVNTRASCIGFLRHAAPAEAACRTHARSSLRTRLPRAVKGVFWGTFTLMIRY